VSMFLSFLWLGTTLCMGYYDGTFSMTDTLLICFIQVDVCSCFLYSGLRLSLSGARDFFLGGAIAGVV
jgi:hypothetical protein